MSAWNKVLTAGERDEVLAAVVDAYKDGTDVRSHAEAGARFDDFIADAVQAGRTWAELLDAEWLAAGRSAWLRRMWSRRDAFTMTFDGQQRERNANRGVKITDQAGRVTWTKQSILAWSQQELRDALAMSARHIDDERTNIGLYTRLDELLERTGAATVESALAAIGKTIDDYLAECDRAG